MEQDTQASALSDRRWAYKSVYMLVMALMFLCVEGGIILFVVPRFVTIFSDVGEKLPEMTRLIVLATQRPIYVVSVCGSLAAGLILKELILRPRARWAVNLVVLLFLLGVAIIGVFGMVLPMVDLMKAMQG